MSTQYRNDKWRDGYEAAARKALAEKRWWDFVTSHETDLYPYALEDLQTVAPFPQWAKAVRDAWYLSNSIMINADRWKTLLEKAGRSLMTDDEKVLFQRMLDPIEVFRGCKKEHQQGLSWSISPRWAHEFPEDGRGIIVRGRAKKDDIVAYIRPNNEEEEVIIFPNNVSEQEILERWMQ